MKKKTLLILPALLAVMLCEAQIEVTSYRGAFAPAPTAMWTDNWTNWDPQNAVYPLTTVNKSGVIQTETWTAGNTYLVTGLTFVDTLHTLTIEPGTIVRFAAGNSSLIVGRGGKLIAEGDEFNPIVFTSNSAAGSRTQGQWGGILLLGRARNNISTQTGIEGISVTEPRAFHGGTDDNDNSGILRYVRIEYGGFIFSANNEINGLTMGSVGRGTTIDHVQVSFVNDDGFEWFGGSVNCKNLVSYRNIDDDFDTDFGYSGQLQFCLGVRDPALADASNSNMFESDNNNTAGFAGTPKTSATFYNVTMIGAFRCGTPPASVNANHFRAAHLRRNTALKIYNSIFMNNRLGIHIQDAATFTNETNGELQFRNNIIAADFTTNLSHVAYNDVATRAALINDGNDSLNICNLLVNAFDFLNPDYRPNLASCGGGLLVSNVRVKPDMSPTLDGATLFTANQARDFVYNIFEGGGVTSSEGFITFRLQLPPGWDVTVPSIALSASPTTGINTTSTIPSGTVNNENANWTFRLDGSTIVITSIPGYVLPAFGQAIIGFRATRKPGTPGGTNQTLSGSLDDNAGGDGTPFNNSSSLVFSAN